jgi:hypothetical protein
MGLLDAAKVAAGVLIGAAAAIAYAQLISIPAARSEARALERAQLDAATTKAIGELTHEADRARVARRLCIERGGVYRNKTGGCLEREAE